VPPTYSARRYDPNMTPKYALSAAQILRFQNAFVWLNSRQVHLYFALQNLLMTWPRKPSPPT
jgi:hypothetical protein